MITILRVLTRTLPRPQSRPLRGSVGRSAGGGSQGGGFIRFVFLLAAFSPAALFGQSLELSSASALPGDRVTVKISVKSPPDKEPVALQWTTVISTGASGLEVDDLSAGPAAKSAGKMMSCTEPESDGGTHPIVCIMAGGLGPIEDGVVALLRFRVSPEAKAGATPLRIEDGLAISAGRQRISLPKVETSVAVR